MAVDPNSIIPLGRGAPDGETRTIRARPGGGR